MPRTQRCFPSRWPVWHVAATSKRGSAARLQSHPKQDLHRSGLPITRQLHGQNSQMIVASILHSSCGLDNIFQTSWAFGGNKLQQKEITKGISIDGTCGAVRLTRLRVLLGDGGLRLHWEHS